MKKIELSTVYSLLALAAAMLLGYCVFSVADGNGDNNAYVAGIGSTICFAASFIPMIAMKHEHSGINMNLRVLSIVFAIILLISNFCYAIFGVAMPYYALVNGLIVIIYWVIYLKLADANVTH